MKAVVCKEHGMADKLELVSDWAEPNLGENPLSGDHALEDVADIGGFDEAGIDPGVGDCPVERFGTEVGGITVRVLPEPGHPDSYNMYVSH